MSFLQNANKGTNLVSTYFLTLSLVVIAYVLIGQIPLLVELSFYSGGLQEFQNENAPSIVAYLGQNKFLLYLILPFVFALITLLLAVKFLHKRPILSVITVRTKFDWKRFFAMFFIWGTVMALFLVLSMFSNASITWNFNAATFFPLLLISFFLIPLQTACEEVLFRGYLFQGFGKIYKKGWISVVLTGLLFGLLHSANPEVETLGYGVMVYYIGTGIFLGLFALMDDGLELSMGYHAVNNIFAALILTNEWQAFQTDALFMDHSKPTFGWDSLVTILIIQPLFLLLFSKVYGWKNWKKKLFS
jgi:membrane protease YdiL (CAAX protease family)